MIIQDCSKILLDSIVCFSPDVLKCKKDRALPGGQLCPMCSSPRHLKRRELQAVESLVCSSPVISSPQRTSPPDNMESEVMTTEDFSEPLGNISLGLSDEHGNEVDLECSITEPREVTKISWEQVNQLQLASNITLSVDIECPVDREKYERLWRLIAYYSNVPAHLQRGIMLRKEPHPTYVYRQDAEKDALYYTGVKVNIMAQPEWLMQTSADLQLNRLQSSAKMVKLILSTDFFETVEAELVRRQRRTWVMIESTNTTRKALSAILGSPSQMDCNVQSSDQPVIQWMLPDGSKMEAPHSSPDNRVSVSGEGQLVIKAVSHTDTGIYYCIAKVHGDLAVLPFHLTVQESSSPLPGEDASITPIEGFVGNPISLPCIASGSPDAEINWILPSSNIVSFQANSSRVLVFSNGTLHIPLTQLLDSGHYKCIAINQHGVDTLATKIIVIRRKGLIRPLRKFPARPQSASGVNTQIKVPTMDTEEASGDNEGTQMGPPLSSLDPLRRRVPGGVATGRRGVHPSRNMWRRPQLLRKPTRSRVEDGKNIVDSRRKINMSKSKIDPEKWADILAKIRDRNAHNTVTPLLVLHTTQITLTEQTTKSQETVEGSSDGMTVQENEGKDYLTTPHIPVLHTTNKHSTQGQDTRVISSSDTAHDTQDMTSNSQQVHNIHSTAEPHTTQTTYNVQDTSPDMNLDLQTTSNSMFFLPQTTSVPLRAVTFWQANTNIASSSSTFSLQENPNTNTDVDRVKTAQWSKASERTKNVDIPNVVASSNNDRELSLSGSQIIPSDNQNGKYLHETATRIELHTQPKDTTLDDLQSQAMLTTAPLTTTQVPTTTRRRGSEGQSSSRLRLPNSKRKNDSRRRRPNRRKQKLNKPTQLIATTPTIAPLATDKTTASSQLKIEALEATLVSFNTTVPFRGSQAASSGRLSHEESKDQGHDSKAATNLSSLPASPPVTNDSILALAKPLFKSTSVAPSFPMSSPGVGHGKTSSPTALGIPDSVFPAERLEMFTSATQQRFTGSLLPPIKPLEETQRVSITGDLGPVPRTNNSSGGFHSVTQVQTDVGLTQSGHQYIPHENDENMLIKETGMQFSLLPSPSASTASFIEHEIKTTSAYTSRGLITTPSLLFEGDLDTEQVTTKDPTLLETSYHTFSQNKTPSNESAGDTHLEVTANIGINADVLITSIVTINPSVISRPDVLIPSRVAQYVTLAKKSPTGAKMDPSLMETIKEAHKIHNISDNRRQSQHIHSINTSEPQRTKDFHLETKADHKLTPFISANPTSQALKLTSGQTIKEMATPVPTISANQTDIFKEGLLTRSQNMSRKHQLPGQGSIPRGKPRITKSNFQTLTVKAETDAQLPCEAEGEPMPFLSWTKVSSGMYDSTS